LHLVLLNRGGRVLGGRSAGHGCPNARAGDG
jgi:hypothetical protein